MVRKIIIGLLLLTTYNSFSTDYLKVLYIADHQRDCGTQKCLLVRTSPEQPYEIWTQGIEGFSYTEGFEYCLLVTSKNTDSTHVSYVLNEIKYKNRTTIATTAASSHLLPDSSIWLLYKLRMKDGSTRTFSMQKAYLQFDTGHNTFSGNSDCNSISGDIVLTDSTIQFGNIVSTKMACGKHSIEPEFMQMLYSAARIKVTPKLLYLMKGKTLLGLFTRKK